ncbi:MAG: efflux RND transporter permease subunit [Wenzhouxiangella sp.]|jgi:multidrug efflux pump subunit AcrB|nr:efflux RND transporter permease subunit [Wenzhouxiangella sp.]
MFEGIIRHGVIVTVAVLIVAVLGVLAALRIPVQMIPDLEVRVVQVETTWPGATPQDVEKEILIEQEQYLRSIPGLERMTSLATYGSASIDLEFPFGTDINEALIRVNNALSQVPSYPENVDEPRLEASSFSQNAFMFFRVAPLEGNPQNLDMRLQFDFLDDNVRPRIERVEGVSRAGIRGGVEGQIRILIDPSALAERGVTLAQVRDAIRARNRDVSAGDVELGKRRYLLRTIGRFESLEELEELIVARRGDSLVQLKEVATVEQAYYEIRGLSSSNGQPSLTISINRTSGSNVIDIKRELLPVIEEINQRVLMPAGMQMTLFSDDVRYVQASVANVWQNLLLGALLATLVMFSFLRSFGATLVGVIGIPICTIAAFLGLLAAGRTINVISLAGVAFAVGMTLDNSIVVLEAIERRRREGLARAAAALEGVRQVWPAVLASTLTTVLVFAPILFIQQEAGQLYSDIAIAISASILASMLVAIAVVPTLSARLRFGQSGSGGRPGHRLRESLLAMVGGLIDSAPRRWATLVGVVVLVLGIIVTLTPPAEYLPEGEEPKTFALMFAPPGYNLEEMRAVASQVEDYLLPFVGDDPQRFERGEVPVPAMAYFTMSISAEQIWSLAETVDPGQIDALMEVLSDFYQTFPGMRAFASRGSIISSNDGGTRSVNLDITGRELADIYRVAQLAYNRAEDLFDNPRLGSSPSSLSLDQPLVEIRPNWFRAAEMGLSASEIGFTVAALTDGAFVDEYFRGDDKIDIFLFSQAGSEQRLDRIEDLPVYVPDAGVVPLSSLAEINETVDTDAIRRLNGRRTVTLNIIPPRAVPLESALGIVEREVVDWLAQEGHLGDEISLDISGASDQLMETRAALTGNYVVAIVLCLLVMVAIFRHWGWPFVILTAVPLGIAGGIGGLALLNWVGSLMPLLGMKAVSQPFDMITMLGFLILLGVVVNNPILLVDRTLANLRAGVTDEIEAVKEAVATRIRPIMMSMITTLFGLAPLVFIPGEGTELYRGVGVIVLTGLLFATLITLTFLPALLVTVLKIVGRRGTATPGS